MNKNLHYYTKDELIKMMREEMPFRIRDEIIPYIKEAMTIYATQGIAHKLWLDYEENILKQEL